MGIENIHYVMPSNSCTIDGCSFGATHYGIPNLNTHHSPPQY
jgi:hypothetical protein